MKKEARFLLIALLILAVIAVLLEVSSRRKSEPPTIEFSSYPLHNGNTIRIKKGDKEVDIVKIDEQWKLQEDSIYYIADRDMVERLINTFKELRGTLVSKNAKKHTLYQVDESQGITLDFFKEDTSILEVIIGKTGEDFTSSYLRLKGRDDVYLVNKQLSSLVPLSLRRWRNRKLLIFAPEEVIAFELKRGDSLFRFWRLEEGNWEVEGIDTLLDEKAIDKFLKSISRIYATGYGDTVSLEEAGLVNPTYRLSVNLKNGDEKVLTIGKEEKKNRYYTQRKGDDTIYVLSGGIIDKLGKVPSSFIKKEETEPKE